MPNVKKNKTVYHSSTDKTETTVTATETIHQVNPNCVNETRTRLENKLQKKMEDNLSDVSIPYTSSPWDRVPMLPEVHLRVELVYEDTFFLCQHVANRVAKIETTSTEEMLEFSALYMEAQSALHKCTDYKKNGHLLSNWKELLEASEAELIKLSEDMKALKLKFSHNEKSQDDDKLDDGVKVDTRLFDVEKFKAVSQSFRDATQPSSSTRRVEDRAGSSINLKIELKAKDDGSIPQEELMAMLASAKLAFEYKLDPALAFDLPKKTNKRRGRK